MPRPILCWPPEIRSQNFDSLPKNCSIELITSPTPTFVDFFAGSGLVTQGVRHACTPVWSNDICAKKAAVYTANHGDDHFHLGSIEHVQGAEISQGDIVWASFSCQDLSLAGKMGGLAASRSGLFWEWLRVLDEMPLKPTVLALENVRGVGPRILTSQQKKGRFLNF